MAYWMLLIIYQAYLKRLKFHYYHLASSANEETVSCNYPPGYPGGYPGGLVSN